MDAPPVQYARTTDGYDIAYTATGPSEATPIVFMPSGVSHVQLSWTPGNLAEWLELLSQRFRLVHYDSRGQGLSTRGLSADFAFDDYLLDLQSVLDRLALRRFILLGSNQFSHVAVRFAAKHPDRVLALILVHSCIAMQAYPIPLWRDVARDNWDFFLQTIAVGPSATPSPRIIERFRQMTSQPDWLRAVEAFATSDVSSDLALVRAPSLLLHAREFPHLRIEEATQIAARIPHARLCITDGSAPFADPQQGIIALNALLADLNATGTAASGTASVNPAELSPRQREVLRLVAFGRTNRQIAEDLVLSERTVERHVADVYAKIGVDNRAQAAVYAKEHGIV